MFNDILPLELFPQGSLTSSVITTVWIGVFVVAFFNLRLGWALSGLVVPGYVAPLLIMKPWSAGAIFVEAIVTYLIVRFLSDVLSRYGLWSSLFGRDRFFALVLASVVVRLVFDGWLLPSFGAWLETEWHIQFDYRNNLYSFGLIIIALIANLFWKTGFWRGSIPVFVTLGVTFLIIRYGLMTMTNFSLSNLGYMYEDIASSVLASPKAYIILITSAFIASRMNLRYGWDYNGILLPSLIALQWYQPEKVLTSFIEAFVILSIAMLVLRTPLFANSNIEGARKLLLFFNIGFLYKLILGYAVIAWFPEVKVTDTYAFGYLLATLMAIKMHDKGIAARLTRATLQTSLVSVFFASAIGFSLTLIPSWGSSLDAQTLNQPHTLEEINSQRLVDVIREDKIEMYRHRGLAGVAAPLPGETHAFQATLNLLTDYSQQGDEALLSQAAKLLNTINYQLIRINKRYLYLREKQPSRGWGLYVFDPLSSNHLLVEAPAPLEERGTMESAAILFELSQARGLLIANTRRSANADGSADVLRNAQSFYHLFHKALSRRDVLQVRGYTPERTRILAGLRRDMSQIELPEPDSTLWVRASLPPSLDLVALKKLTEDFRVEWNDSPFVNLQRETTREGFAELALNRDAIRRLMARYLASNQSVDIQVSKQRIDGYLQQWLLHSKGSIAERGSDRYQIPQVWELLFFDEEILSPLWNIIHTEYHNGQWSEAGTNELRSVSASSAIVGYQLLQYRHAASGQDYLILSESTPTQQARYWGTLVLRLGQADNYFVQVPRPLYETSSFEFGVSLFERMNAKALLIAGAHPNANIDGSADVVDINHATSLFTLTGQVILRESKNAPLMLIQSRAFGYRQGSPSPNADVLVALRNGQKNPNKVTPLVAQLLKVLDEDQLKIKLVDGSIETAGYEIGTNPQAMSLNASVNKEFVMLWGSPQARSSFRQQNEKRQESIHFIALGIPTKETDLKRYILQHHHSAAKQLSTGLIDTLQNYLHDQNIVSLRALQTRWPRYRYERLIDHDSQQSFLAVFKDQHIALVANLAPRNFEQSIDLTNGQAKPPQIQRFIDSRTALLYVGANR